MASRSLGKRLFYNSLRVISRWTGVLVFSMRCRGRGYLPANGAALILSNHQSNLDPVLIGLACDRRMNCVARQTLYNSKGITWLFNALDAIPIDRDGGGVGGLKETLRRLKHGEIVLLFPEGTRTSDGEVQPLKSGFCAIARRAAAPVIPAAMDGAFDSWPRKRPFPRPAVIHVEFGPPLLPGDIATMTDEVLVAEVERRIRECHRRAREYRRRAMCLKG